MEPDRSGNICYGRHLTYSLGASVVLRHRTDRQTDRRTFCFELVFVYEGRSNQGFCLHYVLDDFFLNLASGCIPFFVITVRQ